MKKTIIALMALAGVAAAETTDLLASDANWNFSNSDQISIKDGVLDNTGHWNRGYANYELPNAITLNSNLSLELSYTMTFTNTSDVAATVALHSSSDVLAFGAKTYNGSGNDAPLYIGYTTAADAISANAITFVDKTAYGYIFDSATDTGKTAGIQSHKDGTTVSHNITETIAWDNTEQKFVATISIDGEVAKTQILGDSYTLEKISVTTAGNNVDWRSQPLFSNMQLKVIPEPTTATLSLLALAGLAARRRRK